MSQYLKVTTQAKGCAESLVRTLIEMGCTREDIEICEERRSLVGYAGKIRSQKAHVIVKKDSVCKLVGRTHSASNELGFEKNADGTWSVWASKFDKGIGIMTKSWQSKWLSEWAVQKVGMEAEKKGYSWTTERTEQHVYVHVKTDGSENAGGGRVRGQLGSFQVGDIGMGGEFIFKVDIETAEVEMEAVGFKGKTCQSLDDLRNRLGSSPSETGRRSIGTQARRRTNATLIKEVLVMADLLLKISPTPDGAEVTSLWTDKLDLLDLGPANVVRRATWSSRTNSRLGWSGAPIGRLFRGSPRRGFGCGQKRSRGK